jgi:putative nucleotidyltransferase with HDIG domain
VIEEHIVWFDTYVRSFLTGDPEHDRHIELKKEHSLKVLAEARAITRTLDLSPELARAALLAALYHDVGRFPQYRQYRTFQDARSENHAHLGARSLRQNRALDRLEPGLRGLVLGAVVMHNRRDLPARISAHLDCVARIVRDSDKLDIIRIMLEYLRPSGKSSDVVTLHVADVPDCYSLAIVEQIRAGRIGDYALMRYMNDFKLLILSWVFDLNFVAARRAFRDRGHAQELFQLLPQTAELTQLQDRIYEVLNR